MTELLGTLTATLLTLAIFSRVWGPNPVFRWAEHLLLGVLSGYVAAVVLGRVLVPGLIAPLLSDPLGAWRLWAPTILVALLVLRLTRWPLLRDVGLLPVGMIVGAAGGLALAGAARGTLAPQLLAPSTLNLLPTSPGPADALAVALATLTTIAVLLYFQQHNRADDELGHPLLAAFGWVGRLALLLALGALLATTAGARITLLIDRVHYLIGIWSNVLGGG